MIRYRCGYYTRFKVIKQGCVLSCFVKCQKAFKIKTSRIDKKAKETPGTLICTGYFYMFHSVLSCVILTALSNRDPATGGGEHMEIVISFLVAVAAGVTCHLICKWLDRHNKDNE